MNFCNVCNQGTEITFSYFILCNDCWNYRIQNAQQIINLATIVTTTWVDNQSSSSLIIQRKSKNSLLLMTNSLKGSFSVGCFVKREINCSVGNWSKAEKEWGAINLETLMKPSHNAGVDQTCFAINLDSRVVETKGCRDL